MISVASNIASLNARRNLSNTHKNLNQSIERLSSGLRINRAADDAAGLAVSESMRTQLRGLQQLSVTLKMPLASFKPPRAASKR